ncbi:hypothetical protein BKA70DRAFT_1460993 [Coprinopsis sp. MPI-PUGE-AT-0042]|nr:hypothetical protein BKA70DRAFT_1460993 [Coprinopsis sp. MPI-PUGE-AT-0042]
MGAETSTDGWVGSHEDGLAKLRNKSTSMDQRMNFQTVEMYFPVSKDGDLSGWRVGEKNAKSFAEAGFVSGEGGGTEESREWPHLRAARPKTLFFLLRIILPLRPRTPNCASYYPGPDVLGRQDQYTPFPGPSVEGREAVSVPCMDEAIRYGEGWGTKTEFARFTTQRGATLEFAFKGDNYTSPSTWSSPANSAFTVASSGSSSLTNIHGSSSNRASHAETHQGSAPEPSASIPSQRTSNSDTNSGSAGDVTSMGPMGAIVGSVVGGLVLVIAVTLFIFLLRRRRAKAKAAAYSQSHMHKLLFPFVRPQQPVMKGRTQPLRSVRKGQVATAESLWDQKSGARCFSDESATTSRQAGEGREGSAVNT